MKKLFESYNNLNKESGAGFTIIELLVVVAIIAVLTGIVLVNVTSYINKGKDAAVQGNLASLLTNGSKYFDDNASYTNFCVDNLDSGTSIYEAIFNAINEAPTCSSTDTAWCACSVLKAGGPVFCVDSTGYKAETIGPCTDACPAAGACV